MKESIPTKNKLAGIVLAATIIMPSFAHAETIIEKPSLNEKLALQGDNESERYDVAQATDSNILALAAIADTQFHGSIKGWDITTGTYFWIAGMDVDLTVDGMTTAVDVSFDDILDNFDVIAFSSHMEAWKDKWGIILDFAYLELDSEFTPLALSIDVDVKDSQLMLGGAYRLLDRNVGSNQGKPLAIDALAGLRYHYLKQKNEITGPMGTTPRGGR